MTTKEKMQKQFNNPMSVNYQNPSRFPNGAQVDGWELEFIERILSEYYFKGKLMKTLSQKDAFTLGAIEPYLFITLGRLKECLFLKSKSELSEEWPLFYTRNKEWFLNCVGDFARNPALRNRKIYDLFVDFLKSNF